MNIDLARLLLIYFFPNWEADNRAQVKKNLQKLLGKMGMNATETQDALKGFMAFYDRKVQENLG